MSYRPDSVAVSPSLKEHFPHLPVVVPTDRFSAPTPDQLYDVVVVLHTEATLAHSKWFERYRRVLKVVMVDRLDDAHAFIDALGVEDGSSQGVNGRPPASE